MGLTAYTLCTASYGQTKTLPFIGIQGEKEGQDERDFKVTVGQRARTEAGELDGSEQFAYS